MSELNLDEAPEWMGEKEGEPVNPWSLEAICSSKKWNGMKAVVYGVPGVGKTTFAATFPSPILIRTEDGASAMDVPTFPELVTSTEQLRAINVLLYKEKHPYKTVIIDSLDWLEPIVWSELCHRQGKAHIEDFGYGKGYKMLDEDYRRITNQFDFLNKKGMNVIAISHSAAVTITAPDTDDYMSYSLKLEKRGSAIWTEWADAIFFVDYQKNIISSGKGDSAKKKAIGTGERIIHTASRPAYTAKSRWPLPEDILISDASYKEFHEALKVATDGAYQI